MGLGVARSRTLAGKPLPAIKIQYAERPARPRSGLDRVIYAAGAAGASTPTHSPHWQRPNCGSRLMLGPIPAGTSDGPGVAGGATIAYGGPSSLPSSTRSQGRAAHSVTAQAVDCASVPVSPSITHRRITASRDRASHSVTARVVDSAGVLILFVFPSVTRRAGGRAAHNVTAQGVDYPLPLLPRRCGMIGVD